MTWTRRRKPAPVPPGPPSPDALPWGTLSWAPDTEAEAAGAMVPLLGADRTASRKLKDGRRANGYLYLAHATWIGAGAGPGTPARVARILWEIDGQWLGRIYGGLRPALDAWGRWLGGTKEWTG